MRMMMTMSQCEGDFRFAVTSTSLMRRFWATKSKIKQRDRHKGARMVCMIIIGSE